MPAFLRNRNALAVRRGLMALLLVWGWSRAAAAQNVVLHLKSGDRISGRIVSESTTELVVSNAWTKALSIPLSLIAERKTNTVARPTPPTSAGTRRTPSRKKPRRGHPKPVHQSVAKAHPHAKGTWHSQIRLGLDAIFNTQDQQDYYGDAKVTYERPYAANPKKFFRNTSQLHGEYQRTDGVESANRVQGSNKSDFDIGSRYYAYALAGAGYDDIQKIDLEYKFGPGIGEHLITRKNFVLNIESGLNYEAQYRRDTANLETFYLRFGFDTTWKIRRNLKLTQEEAFYPDMEQEGQYHNDFTANLSYGFWKNLSLNLTLQDDYNTEVAPGVDRNRLEVRSSLGITF